jgi:hypothetical protein
VVSAAPGGLKVSLCLEHLSPCCKPAIFSKGAGGDSDVSSSNHQNRNLINNIYVPISSIQSALLVIEIKESPGYPPGAFSFIMNILAVTPLEWHCFSCNPFGIYILAITRLESIFCRQHVCYLLQSLHLAGGRGGGYPPRRCCPCHGTTAGILYRGGRFECNGP